LAGATDPTYRISKLAAANNTPISVRPTTTKREAVTLMMANDFSQLPVMTTEREVKGVISWASIGPRLALGKDGDLVQDLMDAHSEVRADLSIFQAIPSIVQQGYVLVRGPDNRITGIVTSSDLSLQFQQLAEPFLLLGEIENHIRLILVDKFSDEDLAAIQDPSDQQREVTSVADLTFGDYVRLLESDDRFDKINVPVDRKTFCKQLDEVRRIRNDVMHFDPDGILPSDLTRLREFANFLQRLKTIGVQ
jgi:CBS domain-containing protein